MSATLPRAGSDPPHPEPVPVLDRRSFRSRLVQEAARIQRCGGFLSLVLLGAPPRASAATGTAGEPQELAQRLRSSLRVQDVVAVWDSGIAVLMPDTDMGQATRGAGRLLNVALGTAGGEADAARASLAAGVSTAFGPVEGGADALLAAAEQALQDAAPGLVARSRTLDGRPRVLVVDDDQAFAQTLAETISESGWEAHPCSLPADALRRADDDGYSALFVDLVMPGTGGVQLLRRWLESRPPRPAVLMSGHDAHHEAILDALSLGPVMFVKKPIAPADLDQALALFRELLPRPRRPR